MRSSGSMFITCLTVLILVPAIALANGIYVPTVGSRASAMGAGFIGLADDYGAVYWNPAGITQIKGMEATATGQDVVSLASHSYTLSSLPDQEFGSTSLVDNRIAPGMFFFTDAGPLRAVFDKVGVAAYTLTEYGSKWSASEMLNIPAEFLSPDMENLESRIKTYVISPVLAKEVVPGLSVGVTANIAYSHFQRSDMFVEVYVDTSGLHVMPVQLADDATGWGYGATVGLLYRANRQVSVGLTVRSPMTMAYEGKFGITAADFGSVHEEQPKLAFEMRFPMWAGAGLAYRDFLVDGLTLTAGVQWTDWSTFENINRDIAWAAGSEVPGEFQVALDTTPLDWEDTVEVAVGFEYRLSRSLLLDLGYRNAPSPAPDVTYYFLMPQTTKNIVGFGVTYLQDFWRASFALEYHVGDDRRIQWTDEVNEKHVEDVLIPSLSFTYAF